MLAGFVVSGRNARLLQLARRRKTALAVSHPTHKHPVQPTHRGKQLFGISGGMRASAPTLQGARRGGSRPLVKSLDRGEDRSRRSWLGVA